MRINTELNNKKKTVNWDRRLTKVVNEKVVKKRFSY